MCSTFLQNNVKAPWCRPGLVDSLHLVAVFHLVVTYFLDDLTQLFDPTKSCTKDFLKMLLGKTVNQGFYLAVSQNLQKAMRKKWPEIWKRRLFVCLFVCCRLPRTQHP